MKKLKYDELWATEHIQEREREREREKERGRERERHSWSKDKPLKSFE